MLGAIVLELQKEDTQVICLTETKESIKFDMSELVVYNIYSDGTLIVDFDIMPFDLIEYEKVKRFEGM